MPQVSIYMPDDLHQAVKASGFNLSAVCQVAARAELAKEKAMTKLKDGMGPVTVEVGRDDTWRKQRFTGRILATHEQGDRGWDVYLTAKGKIAVHYGDESKPVSELHVCESFDAFATQMGDDLTELVAEVADALGEDYVEELDI